MMTQASNKKKTQFRSQAWFDDPGNPGMTALYLERYLNYGLTPSELQAGKPIIGIAQTGSDLSPCNRIHLELAKRVRAGITAAGGVAMEFPVHPIQETGKRPTAALDRNLAYLGLVEILQGYPLDAVVLLTGCDKTTPACLMAAATTDLPAIVLSAGPMLDGWHQGQLVGSGSVIWQQRRKLATKEINYQQFMDAVAASAPSVGYCNTMGTAATMNCLAEVLGMSLPGNASIPAPYRERAQMAYYTGKAIVACLHAGLTPSKIMTQAAFDNAIVVNTALGGSSNAQIHITAIARMLGITLQPNRWQSKGYDIPLLVNMQPAGEYLGEAFHRAGGVPAVLQQLLQHGKITGDYITVNGKSLATNVGGAKINDNRVIKPFDQPLKQRAGFIVLSGNLFDHAIMKTSVISESFARNYLQRDGHLGILRGQAVVFEGSEDYHRRIEDPELPIDQNSILVIRGTGPIGWPGSAEVVNMQPPARLLQQGITELPCIGDGRQSGTSASPSILHASPESACGGGLALVQTGDILEIDLNKFSANIIISAQELAKRRSESQLAAKTQTNSQQDKRGKREMVAQRADHRANHQADQSEEQIEASQTEADVTQTRQTIIPSQTPWQEIYRNYVGQLADGACLELQNCYQATSKKLPRHNH